MGQWFNIEGVIRSFHVIRKPSLGIPHKHVKDISAVNWQDLKDQGIDAVGFDKDNCLTEPYSDIIHPAAEEGWRACRRIFGDNICIVSNSAGSVDDKDGRDAQRIEEVFHVPVLRHNHKKPEGGNDLLEHFGMPADKVAFVGDRVLTDVVYGNLAGMFTIHTEAFTEKGDNPAAAIVRRLEYGLLSIWRSMGVQSSNHSADRHK